MDSKVSLMEQKAIIMSLDPGGGTGWCVARIDEQEIDEEGCLRLPDHHDALWQLLHRIEPDILLCEDFVYTVQYSAPGVESRSIELISRDYIGVAKLFCQQNPHVELIMRPPGMNFKMWNDDMLKRIGMYTKGSKKTNGAPHINDAKRHLLDFMVRAHKAHHWIEATKPPGTEA